ncbi:class I SAM-dependent methyltransferase [Pollutimonas bauzanensis]|uniref:Nodulation protein S (NodS) n=1 Tax=Pollutimonas bauzanensis TaxID=658167 RepID=A0A1M5W8R9_9BURK|nr:class I SAM-dependent methyltransferase [Pollutimonas bauzanensis]SHH83922.1 Nodulation protein S (NodS) [Pollutimonas bauzanensis]
MNAGYFDKLYHADPDPWKVRSSWYEQRKRALLMAALPRQHYRRAFEPGCGAGDLTLCLADRSAEVLACDYSAAAVSLARGRLAASGNVRIERRAMPGEWPPDAAGKFDLIIISELAYYLDAAGLAKLAALCEASLAAGGDLAACHWRHPFHDRLQSNAAIHAAFQARAPLGRLARHSEADFLLEVWRKGAIRGGAGMAA